MNDETQQAVTTTTTRAPVAIGARGLQLSDLDGLARFAKYVAASGLAPKGIQTQEAIFTAVQMGLEVGLTPMAALQNIAVINGRPSLWGDAQLAVVRATGELEEFDEWFETDGKRLPRNPAAYSDSTCAVCRVKRRGYPPAEQSFSVADAKAADLWNKPGPWKQYPARMLKFRARSFILRDQFGDALKGFRSAEEAMDTPAIDVETVVEKPRILSAPQTEAKPEPKPDPASEVIADEAKPVATPKRKTQAAPEAKPHSHPVAASNLVTLVGALIDSEIPEAVGVRTARRLWPTCPEFTTFEELGEGHSVVRCIMRDLDGFIAECRLDGGAE